MRKLVFWSVVALMLAASSAYAARGGGATESMLRIGWSQGSGEYGDPITTPGADYILLNSIPEMGINAELSKLMGPDYAVALGFDYRWGSQKAEPTTNAGAGAPTLKLTSTSWKLRLGGDRVGNIGDRFKWFFGPGIEYANGKAKFEEIITAGSLDGPSTTKWGLNGRVGGTMKINEKVGIYGKIGDGVGWANTEETVGGKTSWYYSDFEAAWGLEFQLTK